jgi:hypothetical protein
MALQNTGYDYNEQDAQRAFDVGGFQAWQQYTGGANQNTNPGAPAATKLSGVGAGGGDGGAPAHTPWGQLAPPRPPGGEPIVGASSSADARPWLTQGTGPGGWGYQANSMPSNPEYESAMSSLMTQLQNQAGTPEELNARVQSIMGLHNLPMQQYYAQQMPGVVSNIQNMADAARQRMDPQSYTTPYLTQQDAFSVGPSANMQWIEQQAINNAYNQTDLGYAQPGAMMSRAGQINPAAINTALMADREAGLSLGSLAPTDVNRSLRDTYFWNAGQRLPQIANLQDPLLATIRNIEAIDPDAFQRDAVADSYTPQLNRAITDLGRLTQRELQGAGPGQNLSGIQAQAAALSTPIDRTRVAGMGQSEFLERALRQGESIPTGAYGEAITDPDETQLDAALKSLTAADLSTISASTSTLTDFITALEAGPGGLLPTGTGPAVSDVASTIGTTNIGDLQGTGAMSYDSAKEAITADVNEAFAQQERALEEELAIRGMSNSTLGTESRNRLAGEKARALAAADLEALQIIGEERRANEATAAQILNQSFEQDLARQQLGMQGTALTGQEARANLELQSLLAGQQFGQELAGGEFAMQKALAGAQESRALAGTQNQMINDELQRAIAAGDYDRANDLAQLQAQMGQMSLTLEGAGAEDARRQMQAELGLREDALFGTEARANLGMLADIANQQFGQQLQGSQFEQAQALARGAEGRAQAQTFNQMTDAALQRAIARGDYDQASDIAELQAQQAQVGMGLDAAAQAQDRRMDRLGVMQQGVAQDYQRELANQAMRQDLQRINLDKSVAEAGLERQDVGMVSDLIDQQFQQDLAAGQFNLSRADQQLRATLAQEGLNDEDIDRASRIAQQQWANNIAQTEFAAQEQQRIFNNQLQALQTDENIYNQRAQLAQQPLGQLLSALAGTNVAQGVLGPLQMPLQQPPGGGFGGALGGIAGGLAGSFLGPMGGALGARAGSALFGGYKKPGKG